jgi:hypothetical protein
MRNQLPLLIGIFIAVLYVPVCVTIARALAARYRQFRQPRHPSHLFEIHAAPLRVVAREPDLPPVHKLSGLSNS